MHGDATKIKINGYQLREGIKRWLLQRDAAAQAFKDSVFTFVGEEKDGPLKVMEDFTEADYNLARLEELQQLYNQAVLCNVQGKDMTLALCVKLVGGAGRREKMWRESAVGKKDRYSYRDEARERDTNKEYASRTMTVKDCSAASQAAAKYASAIRNAIARGNSTEVDANTLSLKKEEYSKLFD
jgi:hypothetical protein